MELGICIYNNVLISRDFSFSFLIKIDIVSSFQSKIDDFLKFIGAYSVEVVCRNKKDGKQRASQKMLAKLHPGIMFIYNILIS